MRGAHRLTEPALLQVYLAWDNSLGKFVVVKSTCFSKWKRSIWMENPWREIHMLRLLRRLGAHPNICHSELVNAHGWWRVHPSWERGTCFETTVRRLFRLARAMAQ